jgi:hypothetical protein
MSDATIIALVDFLFVFSAWCLAMTLLHGVSQAVAIFFPPQDQE